MITQPNSCSILSCLAIGCLVMLGLNAPALAQTDTRGTIAPIYVDDDWDGLANGTNVVFTFPDSSQANAVIGTDAFARPDDGLAAASAGGTIYVGAGNYLVGGPGVLRALHLSLDGLSLIGVFGAAATAIDVGGADNGIWLGATSQNGPHPDELLVEGLTVTGWKLRGISQRHGQGRVVVQNNHAIATLAGSQNAIGISGGTGSLVLNNVVSANSPGLFEGGGAGILLAGSREATVQANQVSGADFGLAVAGIPGDPAWALAENNIIADNQVMFSAARGIVLQSNARANTFINNLSSGSPMAVSLSVSIFESSPSDNSFIGNQLNSSSQFGFRVREELLDHPFIPSTLMGN